MVLAKIGGYAQNALALGLAAGAVLLALRLIYGLVRRRKINWGREILFVAIAFYLAVVLELTVVRGGFDFENGLTLGGNVREMNLELFRTIRREYYSKSGIVTLITLGNIIGFIPPGMLIPALWKRCGFANTLLLGFLFTLAIEASQWIFMTGVSDIDDILLNTLGVAIGYVLWWIGSMMMRSIRD